MQCLFVTIHQAEQGVGTSPTSNTCVANRNSSCHPPGDLVRKAISQLPEECSKKHINSRGPGFQKAF